MRIGMCADMYMPHVSGVTNHIRLYKRYFESQGHEVYLFTFGDTDYIDDEPHVYRTSAMAWGNTGWNFSPTYDRDARTLMASCDVLHAHHPFQSGRLAAQCARENDQPLFFTNHTRYDLYSDAYAGFFPRGARYKALESYLSHFYRSCDNVIAPSASIETWLEEFTGATNVATVPNGIDVVRFREPSITFTRAQLDLPDDALVFVYLGRVAPEKNTAYLFSEFAKVAEQIPAAHLLVVGDGPDLETAQADCAASDFAQRVHFLGMRPYEELPGYLALSDVFVTGSISEVHPLVVLEAMAAGLPVVAVRSPGITDTVSHHECGLLAREVAPGALCAEMIAIAKSESLRTRLAKGALAHSEDYSFAHTADRVLTFYTAALARHEQPGA